MGFVFVAGCGAMLGYVVPGLLSLIFPHWAPIFRVVRTFTSDHAAAIVVALVLTMVITQLALNAFGIAKNR